MSYTIIRNRATAVAIAVQLIVETTPPGTLRRALVDFLADELADFQREVAGERPVDDDFVDSDAYYATDITDYDD